MKRKIGLSIALTLSVFTLSLLSSDSPARAQKPSKATWDTGVVTLGPNQILRISVIGGGDTGTHEAKVRFRTMEYTQGTCEGSVCIHQVASDTTSAPVTLTAGEAVSVDILGTTYGGNGRGMVLSNNHNLRVNALIINTVTGEAGATVSLSWSYEMSKSDH